MYRRLDRRHGGFPKDLEQEIQGKRYTGCLAAIWLIGL